MIKIITTNHIIYIGSISKSMKALGIAPIYGPKNGTIFETPTSTAIKAAYGNWKIASTIKVKSPISAASRISPTKNLPHLVSAISTISYTLGRCFMGINATAIRFVRRQRRSFEARKYTEIMTLITKV